MVIKPQSIVQSISEPEKIKKDKNKKKDKKQEKKEKKENQDIPEQIKKEIIENGPYEKHEALVKQEKDGNLTVY